ncbi:MAG: TonB-dependent receptor [Bacteroidia bacterium]|nr:TonB-dependent receptor [Bacteroidia bacterium]
MRLFITISILMLYNMVVLAQDNILNKKISISFTNTALNEVLKEFTAQTNTHFTYGNNIDLSQKVNYTFSDLSFKEALNKLLDPIQIKWELIGNQIALAPGKKLSFKISGMIKDSADKSAVEFATVYLKGEKFNASSDYNGHFNLDHIPPGNYILVVSAFGYKLSEQSIEVTDQPLSVFFEVSQQAISLSETIVTADKIIEKVSVSEMELKHVQIESIKGISNDPMKSLTALPGVLSKVDLYGSSDIHVRGGESNENLFLIDNIKLPLPFHFSGQSVFNPEMLEKAEVLTGGYAANYGNAMSSVFNLTTKNGNAERWSTNVDLNTSNPSYLIQGPLKKNKLAVIVGLRSILSVLSETEKKADLTSKFTYTLNYNTKINLTTLNVNDYSDTSFQKILPKANSLSKINAQNFQIQSVIADKSYSKTSFLHSGWRLNINPEKYGFRNINYNSYTLREDLTFYPRPTIKLKTGIESSVEDERSDITEFYKTTDILITDTSSLIYNRKVNTINILSSAYLIYDASVFKRIKFNAGLRLDHNQLANTFDLSPRVTLGYDLTSSTILSASWGIFKQSPTTFQILQNKHLLSNHSEHTIVSIKQKLTPIISARIEGYYKKYTRLVIFDTNFAYSNKGYGDAKGIEFFVMKESGRVNGWASYSIAKSDKKRSLQDKVYPYYFDQRQSLNIVLSASMKEKNRRWFLPFLYTFDFRYATGEPYTPVTGIDSLAGKYEFITGNINSVRNPDYNTLNIKLQWHDRAIGKRKRHMMQFYLNFWNIYGHSNLAERNYKIDPTTGSLTVANVYRKFFDLSIGLKFYFNYYPDGKK